MIYIKKLTNEEFLNRMEKINPNIEFLSEYKTSSMPVKCKCKIDGNEWNATPDNLFQGKGCKICANRHFRELKLKPHIQLVTEMKNVNKDIQIISTYNGASKNIECKCLIHNQIFFASPTHLLAGETGCNECIALKNHQSGLKTHEQFIKDLYKVNKDIIVLGVYNGAKFPIKVQCKKCGCIWSPVASSLLSGYGCPECTFSKGEEKVKEYLIKNHIKFTRRKTFDDLKGVGGLPLSYDFYLPDYNLLIEYQGQFHDGIAPIQTKEGFDRQKEHDSRKKQYTNKNKINFLEIWYYDFDRIEEIITTYINNFKNPVTTTAI